MKDISTKEIMVKLDMFQARSGNDDDYGMQFTSKEFQEGLYVCVVQLALASPYHQEMIVQVEATWQTLRTITPSIMLNTRVSDKYIHFALMYTTDNMFPVIPIKHLVNKDGEPTRLHKLATGTKPLVSTYVYYFVHVCMIGKYKF